MKATAITSKRQFVRRIGTAILVGALVPATGSAAGNGVASDRRTFHKRKDEREDGISPAEDLMREHGVLRRILLIYEAGIRKLASGQDFDPAELARAAQIVHDFIGNYHEKLEENYTFPRFRRIGRLTGLVDTLAAQHVAGRRETAAILQYAPGSRAGEKERQGLIDAMQAFIAMYRPHAACEDTELFPMLKNIVTANEYAAMAAEFEREEELLFGQGGFEQVVDSVSEIGRVLGINGLAQFPPK